MKIEFNVSLIFNYFFTTLRSTYKDDLLQGCGVIDSGGCSVMHMAGGSAGLVILWLTTPRESNNNNTLIENKGQSGILKKDRHNETANDANHKIDQLPKARKSAKKEYSDTWKRYHIVPTLDANDIVNIDFKSRQMYATICAPLLLWIGFLGSNVLTNLPQNNIADLAGKRLV
jgi:ammonia channel protein AmtB